MTHDELLAEINGLEPIAVNCNLPFLIPYFNALRAVVELHKPKVTTMKGEPICGCAYGAWTFYPCPTIQALEKELK